MSFFDTINGFINSKKEGNHYKNRKKYILARLSLNDLKKITRKYIAPKCESFSVDDMGRKQFRPLTRSEMCDLIMTEVALDVVLTESKDALKVNKQLDSVDK